MRSKVRFRKWVLVKPYCCFHLIFIRTNAWELLYFRCLLLISGLFFRGRDYFDWVIWNVLFVRIGLSWRRLVKSCCNLYTMFNLVFILLNFEYLRALSKYEEWMVVFKVTTLTILLCLESFFFVLETILFFE